jgi:hypothetical protein
MTPQIQPIAPTLVGNLLSLAKAYADAKSIKLETVGYNAAKEKEFFLNLESGKSSCTLRKYDLLTDWFLSNWPEGVSMPTLNDTQHLPSKPKEKVDGKEAHRKPAGARKQQEKSAGQKGGGKDGRRKDDKGKGRKG